MCIKKAGVKNRKGEISHNSPGMTKGTSESGKEKKESHRGGNLWAFAAEKNVLETGRKGPHTAENSTLSS